MPHVIIADPPPLQQFYDSYEVWVEKRSDGSVLQTRGAFLRDDRMAVLVECITVEIGPPVHFFVVVETKRKQITVRCYPHPSPPRTESVKTLIGVVARKVLALGGKIERTNLDLE
ncbi:MAG: hypothetical protein AAF581_20135 [Planctomycetota bacterium]